MNNIPGALKLIAMVAGIAGFAGIVSATDWGSTITLSAFLIGIQTVVGVVLLFAVAHIMERLEHMDDDVNIIRHLMQKDDTRALVEHAILETYGEDSETTRRVMDALRHEAFDETEPNIKVKERS